MSHNFLPPESAATREKSQRNLSDSFQRSCSRFSTLSDLCEARCALSSSPPSSSPKTPFTRTGLNIEYSPSLWQATPRNCDENFFQIQFPSTQNSRKSPLPRDQFLCINSAFTDTAPRRLSTLSESRRSSFPSRKFLNDSGGAHERSSSVFYESEDETQEEDEEDGGYSFPEHGRLTFQTSAERWHWRYDRKIETPSRRRQSDFVSTHLPNIAVNTSTRPGSEPASSISCMPTLASQDGCRRTSGFPLSLSRDSTCELPSTPSYIPSLPSLASDRASSEPDHVFFSPLPPSSPPLSSHSMLSSPFIPLCSPISCPSLNSKSPLMRFEDQDLELAKSEGDNGSIIVGSPVTTQTNNFQLECDFTAPKTSLLLGPCCPTKPSFLSTEEMTAGRIDSSQAIPQKIRTNSFAGLLPSSPSMANDSRPDERIGEDVADVIEINDTSGANGKGKEKIDLQDLECNVVDKTLSSKRKGSENFPSSSRIKKARSTNLKIDLRGDKENKGRLTETSVTGAKLDGKKDSDPGEQSLSRHLKSGGRQSKQHPLLINDCESNTSASSTNPKPELDDNELREIRGMLIECMATSRASSLPLSVLYKLAMQCRPSLRTERSEQEWMAVFEGALRDGGVDRGGSGMFGRVDGSSKHTTVEAQWFYVPENDEDQERATLLRTMMRRPGKRSETKKYKQYYYRPLEKITKWDAEDEL